jgi:hypothetical protein
VTVELAHPSTEPKGLRSPAEPAHPRWWFISTTPGRILTIGIERAQREMLRRYLNKKDEEDTVDDA